MDFRTTFTLKPSLNKIDYTTPVMFIGSCFSTEIGKKMEEGKMKVLINPFGTVYNPVSVGKSIENIIEKKVFTVEDLFNYKGLWVSFSHYSNYSSEYPERALEKINSSVRQAHEFLKNARYLIVTFGTARIYRMIQTGMIVSNCHKLPSSYFKNEQLDIEEIVNSWNSVLDMLHAFNEDLHVIFTISPVRHWKDGAHGNQVSKSVLLLGTEKLLGHKAVDGYFPAYELVMDDLRDYRFYADDMLHPSHEAIDYVWKAFSECYLTAETLMIWKELQGLTIAKQHRFLTDSVTGKKDFANNMLARISEAERKYPSINLEEEKSYFSKMLENS